MQNKKSLRDYTLNGLEELVLGYGQPKFRAKQLFKWLYSDISSFDEMTNIPKAMRDKLSEKYSVDLPKIKEKFVSDIDGTRRYLLQLDDGNLIESVLMKYHHGFTICVSSQVGCAMGCAFCASTRGGKVRNLTAAEIIGQLMTVQSDIGQRISNIVMMGMGEPFDNFDNVLKFLEIVNHEDGLNIGHRHITVSTCGLCDRIKEFADLQMQVNLSVSLHATNDEKRSEIMPINRKYNINELISACRYYLEKTNRRITFEYTLIHGVNDSEEDAEELLNVVSGLLCHVNLIPVNEVKETGFEASKRESVNRFCKMLEDGGISATVRREMGADISAACGQLRAAAERKV